MSHDKYKGLPQVYLGQGVNYQTGKLKNTGVDEKELLICQENSGGDAICKSVIKTNASEYVEFGTFDARKEDAGYENKHKASAGGEISYGLSKASLKAVLEHKSSNSNTDGNLNISAGLIKKQSYYLPYDTQEGRKEPNKLDIKYTSLALTKASADLKKDIDGITEEYGKGEEGSSLRFNELIEKFYAAYGSHFISSVVRGHIGQVSYDLTFTGSQSDSSSSMAGEAKFTTASMFLGAGGTAGYSAIHSNSFSNSTYHLTYDYYATPYSQETNQAITAIAAKLWKTVGEAKKDFDFSNMDTKKYKEGHEYPALPDIPQPSEEQKAAAKKKWGNDWSKDKEVKNLAQGVNQTKKYIAQASEENYEPTKKICQKKGPYQTIKTALENIDAYKENKPQFQEEELRKIILSKIIRGFLRKNNCGDVYNSKFTKEHAQELKELLNNKEDAHKKKDKDARKASEAQDFLKWMKDKKYYEETKGKKPEERPTFDQWYSGIKVSEMPAYKKEWTDYYKKTGAITKEMEFLLNNNIIGSDDKGNELESANLHDKNEYYATLDYNIMPWSKVFPILDATIKDNYAEAIILKLFNPLNQFLLDREYLKLTKNSVIQSKQLDNYYNADHKLAEKMKKLGKTIINSYDTKLVMDWGGEKYDLMQEEGLKGIETVINGIISKSEMRQHFDTTYANPLGYLLSAKNWEEWLVTREDKEECNNFYYYKQHLSKHAASEKNYGELLAEIGASIGNVPIYLPINAPKKSYFLINSFKKPIISKNKGANDKKVDITLKDSTIAFFLKIKPSKADYIIDKCGFFLATSDIGKGQHYLAAEGDYRCYHSEDLYKSSSDCKLIPITKDIINSYKSSNPTNNLELKLFYTAGFSIQRQIANMFLKDKEDEQQNNITKITKGNIMNKATPTKAEYHINNDVKEFWMSDYSCTINLQNNLQTPLINGQSDIVSGYLNSILPEVIPAGSKATMQIINSYIFTGSKGSVDYTAMVDGVAHNFTLACKDPVYGTNNFSISGMDTDKFEVDFYCTAKSQKEELWMHNSCPDTGHGLVINVSIDEKKIVVDALTKENLGTSMGTRCNQQLDVSTCDENGENISGTCDHIGFKDSCLGSGEYAGSICKYDDDYVIANYMVHKGQNDYKKFKNCIGEKVLKPGFKHSDATRQAREDIKDYYEMSNLGNEDNFLLTEDTQKTTPPLDNLHHEDVIDQVSSQTDL